jgi:hypothetical protein
VQLPAKRLVTTCRNCAAAEAAAEVPATEADEGITLVSEHRCFQLQFYRYLAEMRAWGFPMTPDFHRERPCLVWARGTFEDYLRLRAKWREMMQGELVACSATLLKRHHEDDLTHGLTTQGGSIGHLGRPYAQRYRTDLLQLVRAPRPEVVVSMRDRSAM